MDGQLSFASLDFAGKKKRTKRDVFLAEMAAVVPWSVLESLIEPHYPKVGPQGGRRPFPIAVMLRIYCLQHWYTLSDPGAEEALYDIQSMRAFCKLELGRDPIPDETTILNFRHLLETHGLTKAVFEAVADHLEARGALLRGGTIGRNMQRHRHQEFLNKIVAQVPVGKVIRRRRQLCDPQASEGAPMAGEASSLDVPLHPDISILAQCGRRLLCQTHAPAPPARRVPIRR